MLDFNPDKRPDIEQIFEEDWMKEVKEDDINQEKEMAEEFKKRIEIIKETNADEYLISLDSSESIDSSSYQTKGLEKDFYIYFEKNFKLKYIDDNELNMKEYLKINGYLEPTKFMNLIANEINNKINNCILIASDKYYKFNIEIEKNNDERNKEENEENEEKSIIEYEEGEINDENYEFKNDLIIQVKLFSSNKGYHLLRFFKLSGEIEEYFEYLEKIISLLKDSI